MAMVGTRSAPWLDCLNAVFVVAYLAAATPAVAAGPDNRTEAPIAGQNPAAPIAQRAAAITRTPLPAAPTVDRAACDHIRYAIDLAGRGAVCSASAELVDALNSVALALDSNQSTPTHRIALESGLRAIHEAEDFAPQGVSAESQVNLARVIAVHRTPVLKSVDVSRLTQMDALESYYGYATDQLAQAGGHEMTASMAMHGCGRMELVAPALGVHGNALAAPRAIAWQRAALLVDPKNYLAADELGVLLGRCEQWQEAKQLLVHSVLATPTAEGWHNLSVAYAKLGDKNESQRAYQQYMALAGTVLASAQGPSGSGGAASMRWVDPAVFVRDSGPDQLGPLATSPERSKQTPSTVIAPPSAKDPLSQISSWLNSKRGDTADTANRADPRYAPTNTSADRKP